MEDHELVWEGVRGPQCGSLLSTTCSVTGPTPTLSPSFLLAQADEPTASSWLKVRRYAEVPEQDGHLPLLSIYMAIVWRLGNRGSERWGRQIFEFSWWL